MRTVLAPLLACALAAAGCGGGKSSAVPAGAREGVASCKQTVDQAQGLSASVKEELEGICDKAAEGDESAVRKATQDVCVKIVEENTPARSARYQAVADCKRGTSG
jgi:hypothetical protein